MSASTTSRRCSTTPECGPRRRASTSTSGVEPPTRWGDETYLRDLWGDTATVVAPRKTFLFRFPSPEHHVDFFARRYGPTVKAVEAVGEAGREALLSDILEAVRRFNRADDGTLVLQMDYLEVVATKR